MMLTVVLGLLTAMTSIRTIAYIRFAWGRWKQRPHIKNMFKGNDDFDNQRSTTEDDDVLAIIRHYRDHAFFRKNDKINSSLLSLVEPLASPSRASKNNSV
eukprot:PhF_6_TR313/c0_g1_i1/m.108